MKNKIRSQILKKRSLHPKKHVLTKSEAIQKTFLASRDFKSAKTIMLYLPIKNEVGTKSIILQSQKSKKRIFLPCIEKNEIVPRKFTSFSSLKSGGPFGILEPKSKSKLSPSKLDLVIVPGVAFDLHGGRIGFGRGYYDRFLKKAPNAKKIGLAYDFQVVDHFPKEPHDILVDEIITEIRAINCVDGRQKNR